MEVKMKKLLLISMFISALLFMVRKTDCLLAQGLTVPDYSYGMVNSEYGTVTQSGIANPGPYGGYSVEEDASPSDVSFGHGYRWWGYPSFPLLICGPLPHFDFPGLHAVWEMLATVACMNPPIGHMGSWGGVVIEPDSRKIWCLTGAKKYGGPTAPYCIPNPYGPGQICYGIPSIWGQGSSYGYLRKVVVIKSTGSLQKGDPVDIRVKLSAQGTSEGDGIVTSRGVLMMNRQGNAMEYMRWSDVSDFFGAPMLTKFSIDLNTKDSSTVALVIGDTIKVELAFYNYIKHINPGSPSEAIGWAGIEPHNLLVSRDYARTDSVRKIIKKNGNSLTYDLVCLTQGAVLEPLTSAGPNVDEDKDGISDAREKGADGNNSNYDGNTDGIPDCKQSNVASFHTFNGQNYVTLVVPSGTELSQLKVTDNPSPADKPAGAEFPWGFFDFSIDGLDQGEAVAVTLILHNAVPVGKYYKYGMTPDNPTSHWYEFMYNGQTGTEINGNVITLHFIDGLRGDEDITVNGSIKEPGGPSKSITTDVPYLIETGGINVYPNPATDHITLQLNNLMPANDYLLRINSIIGKVIQEKLIAVREPNQEFVIPIDDLPGGTYFITISGNNYNYRSKFIKLK
jgi:hypothetical protein